MRRATPIIFVFVWLFAIGHCLAENFHTHTDSRGNNQAHHHHHNQSDHDTGDKDSSHGDSCELKNLDSSSSSASILKAVKNTSTPAIAHLVFSITKALWSATSDYGQPFLVEPPDKLGLLQLLTTSLLKAPNAPPFSA